LWLLLVPCSALAQELSEQQVAALIRRGEQLLLSGQPKQALESTQKLTAVMLAEGALNYTDYAQLWDRATVLSATALVRLEGRDPTRPGAEPRKHLEEAEQRFVELLGAQPTQTSGGTCNCSADSAKGAEKPALWRSRHGEALVALGRYEDAYRVLSALFVASSLTEAEGAAALARASVALSNEQMATAADARCRALAKKRAKSVCQTLPKPAAAR
jgi:tetratricopeptide (TPR) repeat protein